MTTLTEQIDAKSIRQKYGFTRKTFSRITGYSVRTIASWESGSEPDPKGLTRLNEVRRLWEALAEVMEPEFIADWLKSPNDAFGDLKPIEVIERGETDRIWRMIFYLESGSPST